MTSIVNWHYKLAKNKVVELIQKHFYEPIVLHVMQELARFAGLDQPKPHKNTQNRTALSLYAEELCDMLTEVVNHRPGRLPDYLVSANELHLLPIESLTEAEVSIAVRMDKLEKAVLELAKRPQEAVQEVARRPQE